jgi:outer membrane protein
MLEGAAFMIAVHARVASLCSSAALAIAASATARAAPVLAASEAAPRTLTMSDALAYAHAHQPAVRAALARVDTRLAEAKVPSGQWLPTVTATAQIFAATANNTTGTYVAPRSMDVPRIGGTPATVHGSFMPYASTFAGAGVLQEVFDFGRIGAERAAADALVGVERHAADAARLDVDFGVEEAFFAVLAAKGVVRVANEAYARALVHRDLARRGVDSGLRSPIELTRAEADLAQYDVGRLRAVGGLSVAQSVLAAAVGAPNELLDVADQAPVATEMPALGDALAMAQARDPEVAATLAQLRSAEARTRAIGAELRPNLSATATISGRAGGAPSSAGVVPTGNGWLPAVPNWDAGLLLTWPLFDGVVSARRAAAATEERERREAIDVARLQLIARVRETFEQVQVARTALVALENEAVAARANWEQADARFRAGIGNAVEVADAEGVRAGAEVQVALGRFELERSRAAFGRAIAEGL